MNRRFDQRHSQQVFGTQSLTSSPPKEPTAHLLSNDAGATLLLPAGPHGLITIQESRNPIFAP
jgi:hypothetical protein